MRVPIYRPWSGVIARVHHPDIQEEIIKSNAVPYYASGHIGLSLVEIGHATAVLEETLLAKTKNEAVAIEETQRYAERMQVAE